jgi:uncharacterized protein
MNMNNAMKRKDAAFDPCGGGIGRKGINDGVVLLIAPRERKVRIAVGPGLGRQLTDDLCRTIIEQQIIPRFRTGEMPDGIEAGVDALSRALKEAGK